MNKGTVVRAGIIFGLFVLILGVAWIVSSVKDKNDTPVLTNPDGAYLEVEDYTITRAELWDKMRVYDGLSYLTQYIEKEYFYKTEIAAVTDQEVADKIELFTYGTNDDDKLAEIFADTETKDYLDQQLANGMKLVNLDPTDPADLRAFVELEVAKDNATRAYILAADSEDDLYISDDTLKTYYESNVTGDVCAINIKFNSVAEAANLFNKYNLVPNYNLGWGNYTGTEDIADLTTGDFDSDNTEQLEPSDVFDEFIKMYNFMNPDIDDLAGTLADFETTCDDSLVYDYSEITEDRTGTDPYYILGNYMFNTLDIEEDNSRFSFNLQEIGEFQILSFKISEEEVTAFDDLTQTELDDLKVEVLESKITDTVIAAVNTKKWEAAEFEIFDPILKTVYYGSEFVRFDNSGSKEIIATINGDDITADFLFDYMEPKVGAYYSIDIIQTKVLLASEDFTEMFGTDYDYVNSKNEEIVAYTEELRNMKSAFSGGNYAQYGFDNTVFDWGEFLALAFRAQDENEAIQNLYLISALQPTLVTDAINFDAATDIMQEIMDEYFSLNVVHLLAYTDFDNDLSPDEFNDYVDGLSVADKAEYDAMKAEIENLIETRLNNDKSFNDIITEFNDSLLNDPENEWADVKEYGFHIMTQDLSASESLTPATTESYDKDFVVALKAMYDEYVVVVDTSATTVEEYYYKQLVQTNFGLHYLQATEGDDFDMPSAVYTEAMDLDTEYPEDANGTTVLPNADQAALYIAIENAEKEGKAIDSSLPTSVYNACETFFGPTYTAYFTSSSFSIVSAEFILDNSPQFAANTADRVAYIEVVREILYSNTFEEGFVVPE